MSEEDAFDHPWLHRPVQPNDESLATYIATKNRCMMHPPQNPEVQELLLQKIAQYGIRVEPKGPTRPKPRPIKPPEPQRKGPLKRAGSAVTGEAVGSKSAPSLRRRASSATTLAVHSKPARQAGAHGSVRDASSSERTKDTPEELWLPPKEVRDLSTEPELNHGLGLLRARAKHHRTTAETRHRVNSELSLCGNIVLNTGTPGSIPTTVDNSWNSMGAHLAKFHNSAMRSRHPSGMEQYKLQQKAPLLLSPGAASSGILSNASSPIAPAKRRMQGRQGGISNAGAGMAGDEAPFQKSPLAYAPDKALQSLRDMKRQMCPEEIHVRSQEEERIEKALALKADLGAMLGRCIEEHAAAAFPVSGAPSQSSGSPTAGGA